MPDSFGKFLAIVFSNMALASFLIFLFLGLQSHMLMDVGFSGFAHFSEESNLCGLVYPSPIFCRFLGSGYPKESLWDTSVLGRREVQGAPVLTV